MDTRGNSESAKDGWCVSCELRKGKEASMAGGEAVRGKLGGNEPIEGSGKTR